MIRAGQTNQPPVGQRPGRVPNRNLRQQAHLRQQRRAHMSTLAGIRHTYPWIAEQMEFLRTQTRKARMDADGHLYAALRHITRSID